MPSIIVAFSKPEDAKYVKSILVRSGYDPQFACTKGATVANVVNKLDTGLVICGYRLQDMLYSELQEYLPRGFKMIVIASAARIDGELLIEGVRYLSTPIKTMTLINTMNELMELCEQEKQERKSKAKPPKRSEAEQKQIDVAKEMIMAKNKLTEEEAHRFMQKMSMDSGTSLLETAKKIVLLKQ